MLPTLCLAPPTFLFGLIFSFTKAQLAGPHLCPLTCAQMGVESFVFKHDEQGGPAQQNRREEEIFYHCSAGHPPTPAVCLMQRWCHCWSGLETSLKTQKDQHHPSFFSIISYFFPPENMKWPANTEAGLVHALCSSCTLFASWPWSEMGKWGIIHCLTSKIKELQIVPGK